MLISQAHHPHPLYCANANQTQTHPTWHPSYMSYYEDPGYAGYGGYDDSNGYEPYPDHAESVHYEPDLTPYEPCHHEEYDIVQHHDDANYGDGTDEWETEHETYEREVHEPEGFGYGESDVYEHTGLIDNDYGRGHERSEEHTSELQSQ